MAKIWSMNETYFSMKLIDETYFSMQNSWVMSSPHVYTIFGSIQVYELFW